MTFVTTKSKIKELSPIIWNEQTQTPFLIDQRLIPYEFKYVEIKTHEEMAKAIKDMLVRGAPAIGIAAAFGMVLAAKEGADLKKADSVLRSTRPTAVNLMWALDEMQKEIEKNFENKNLSDLLLAKAKWILADDIDRCKKISENGAKYIKEKFANKISTKQKLKIMTHCNAGALATGGYGTALGVIRKLHEENLVEMVFANETRPRQQGARLTVWELAYEHIPVTLTTDNMAAHLMKNHEIDLVIVGADRITRNGDAANKIGTYGLAIIAKHHNVPFYVAAPQSTFDTSLEKGSEIEIEERCHTEITHINGQSCTATIEHSIIDNYDLNGNQHKLGKITCLNPGFDVTPNELIEKVFSEIGNNP